MVFTFGSRGSRSPEGPVNEQGAGPQAFVPLRARLPLGRSASARNRAIDRQENNDVTHIRAAELDSLLIYSSFDWTCLLSAWRTRIAALN
jgi:hypothetical protein